MNLKANTRDLRWWFWRVTLVFIVATLFRWPPGHWIVVLLSAVHVLFYFAQEKSFSATPVQIRVIYFGLTLLGLWSGLRLLIYLILLVETVLVTFFGRSLIAGLLERMPWNKQQPVRLN